MKKICLLILISFLNLNCHKKENKNIQKKENKILESINKSKIIFKSKILDLGNIKSNDSIISVKYYFTNISDIPAKIEYVSPDCSCTGFKSPENPILKDSVGIIELLFNKKNKFGHQKIYAIVKANTEEELYKLTLKMNIAE